MLVKPIDVDRFVGPDLRFSFREMDERIGIDQGSQICRTAPVERFNHEVAIAFVRSSRVVNGAIPPGAEVFRQKCSPAANVVRRFPRQAS